MKVVLFTLTLLIAFVASAQVKIESNRLIPDKEVTFITGSAELTVEGKEALQQVKNFLMEKDYITTMRVEAHTDNTNAEEKSQALSEQRALTVCRWLVANGIDCKRLLPVGFGSTKPVASNDTPMGKAQNRRMEFALAALRGRLIGGMPADGGGRIAGDACAK